MSLPKQHRNLRVFLVTQFNKVIPARSIEPNGNLLWKIEVRLVKAEPILLAGQNATLFPALYDPIDQFPNQAH